jgi:hypothetical protein
MTKIIISVVTSVVSAVAAAVIVEKLVKRDSKSTMAGEAPFQNGQDPILKTFRRIYS